MNIFESNDYKDTLRKLVSERRKDQKGLSRKLAEYLGVHPTLVSQILSGNKDFTEEQLLSVCDFFGLTKAETHYLLTLVQIERAGSHRLREHYRELKEKQKLENLVVASRISGYEELSEAAKAVFYSNWMYSAVHIATTLDVPPTFEKIRERFDLDAVKTREVLDFLIEHQLVREENGVYLPGSIYTHLERRSPFLFNHYCNWRLKAMQAADSLAEQELMYSANISLSKEDFASLREQMVKFIEGFAKTVQASPAEDIACFNLDFFWIR